MLQMCRILSLRFYLRCMWHQSPLKAYPHSSRFLHHAYQNNGKELLFRHKRLKEFLETEFEDDPELRVARAADGKPPIIPDWDGPLFCYATDRIAQKGYKIKGAKRIMPEREEWGWESGWGFFSDDDIDRTLKMQYKPILEI